MSYEVIFTMFDRAANGADILEILDLLSLMEQVIEPSI